MNTERIRTLWFNLSDRDRYMLCIGGVMVLVYLFYLVLYLPLVNAVEWRSQQWTEKKETLSWMQTQAKAPKPTQQREGPLLSIFSDHLKETSFSQFPYQLQQAGENTIQLTFEHVPYVDAMSWLQKLNKQYRMTVTELTVERTQTPGVVKLSMVVTNHKDKLS